MTIEIDHLTAAALLDLAPGQVGGGYFTGTDFRAWFDADTLGVAVEFCNDGLGVLGTVVLPFAVVEAAATRPVCGFLGDIANALFA
jgi:hypothetical protein